MTECASSAKQALEKLNEQLTCPICLEQYTDPKLLHCFHVFCEKCLKPVAQETTQGQMIECPNCRHPTSLTQEGVLGLQRAFLIHHLIDIQDILKKVYTSANNKCVKCKKRESNCYCRSCGFLCGNICKDIHSEWEEFSSHEIISLDKLTEDATNLVPPDQKNMQCPKHPATKLDLYCETCKEVICRDCILKVHRDHQYDLAIVAFPQQKNVLVGSIEPAEQQLASVNKALEDLNTLRGEIISQHQALKTKIRSRIGVIHEALKAREEELTLQLDQITEQKLKNLSSQLNQLEVVAIRLKSCCGFLQESLRTGSQIEILAMRKSFVEQVQDVTSLFKPESLVLQEQADLEFVSDENKMTQICQQFGEIDVSRICHAKCHAKCTGLHLAKVGETASAMVHVVDQKGRQYQGPMEMSCMLVSSDGSSEVRVEAKKVKDGEYKISYRPQHRGQHHLHIKVEGKHISGSPFPLSVLTTKPTNIISDVNRPWGVALDSNGQLLVAEQGGHCISIFNDNGKKEKTLGSRGFSQNKLEWPYGIAVSTRGDIIVCDTGNKRINILSPDGKSLKCLGTKPLQFIDCYGISLHPHSNKVYVTECDNHRVMIYNKDLTFCSTFGSRGSDSGQFQRPHDVSFDSDGNVYVVDTNNHRVQVFTANGEYIRQFGKEGSGEGELNEPRGIAIDKNDIVYVSELNNHQVSIFTPEGQFLRSFGSRGDGPGQFNCPSGITVSNEGVIYISDWNNYRVQVF